MPEKQPGTSLAIPADIRADLLKAQKQSIQTKQNLPKVAVMPQGVGLFEFEDTNETTDSFRGVILNNHPMNVLWDKAFGASRGDTDEDKFPACSSPDGRYGIPRKGFQHAALGGRPATERDRIACDTCPYNQFGTGNLFKPDGNPKGKAVSNYRSVYVVVEGREAPVELRLPSMSLNSFDGYLSNLLNKGTPVQAVITEFRQTKGGSGGKIRYGVVTFANVGELDPDTFDVVMAKRTEYANAMNPTSTVIIQQEVNGTRQEASEAEIVPSTDDDEIPF